MKTTNANRLNFSAARKGVAGLAGLVSVATTLPLIAIENPAVKEAAKNNAKQQSEAPAEELFNKLPKLRQQAEIQGEQKQKQAMIGLGGAAVSETLSHQLGLESGTGLTIFHIVPGSAADKVGLQPHDILTRFDGKNIGSQQDLRDAVGLRKPGDEVSITYIRKGQAIEKKLVLGERPDQADRVLRGNGALDNWFRGMGNMPEADQLRIEEQMQKHMDDLRNQLNDHGGMRFDLKQWLENAAQAEIPKEIEPLKGKLLKNFNFNSSSSITMKDDQGSVTMKTVDGNKEVTVKDKDGNTLYEGPYQTEQDKAAVPDDIRDRLEKLNLTDGENGAFRLQVLPKGMNVPAAPEAPAAEPEHKE